MAEKTPSEKIVLDQAKRMLAIQVGKVKLRINDVTVQEQLSRLFHIEATLTAEDEVDLEQVIGQNATISLKTGEKTQRFFNGYISRISQGVGDSFGLRRFRAEIVPWLWFLTRRSDCRIHEKKTVPEICEVIFKEHGFSTFKFKLSESHLMRETCVQYRETDFNFVSRLLEQEGIYYFTEHKNGEHTLVLADSASAHPPATPPEITYGVEIVEWNVNMEVQAVAYAHTDFDFEKPKNPLVASSEVTRPFGGKQLEIFDYPGEYLTANHGTHLADVRLAELQSQYEVLHGETELPALVCGATFKMKSHPEAKHNREYLITSTVLTFAEGDYVSGDSGPSFSCQLTAIDRKQQFRAPRTTPKPVVQGVQTAIVVGGGQDKEIYTDKYGRVRVRFHWIRNQAIIADSCWMRVSQGWAGKQWGAMVIPRVGQEVIVSFLEGDPDQPIVTGRVYNGEAMPPYELPTHKTKSTVKTNTTPDGGGFNEIRFEDKKGEEQIFVHGEKNQDVRIKNDCYEWIGHDRHLIVKNDQVEHVENNRDEIVDGDHKEKIAKDRHLKVAGKEAKEVVKSLSLTVKDDVIEVFKKNHSEQTTNDYFLKADNVVIEALTNITIKVGQSYIAIESGGIKIGTTGTIDLESTGATTIKATADLKMEATANASLKGTAGLKLESTATAEMKSPATTVKGDGMLTLKGGVVMIN